MKSSKKTAGYHHPEKYRKERSDVIRSESLLCAAFTVRNAGNLGEALFFRLSFLQLVAICTFRHGIDAGTAYTEKIGSAFGSAFVKPVFTILFFQVGIRTGRVWRGIVVIKIRFVNDLFNIIQNHVGMNCIKQVVSIYVSINQEHSCITRDYSEGNPIYDFRIKMQEIASYSDDEKLPDEVFTVACCQFKY